MRRLPVALLLLPTMAHAQFVPMPPPDRFVIGVALTGELRQCWSIPEGFSGTRIVVDLLIGSDGSLAAEPDFSAVDGDDLGRYAPLIGSIRRAAQRCAPFSSVAEAGRDEDLPVRVTFVVP